MVISSHGYILVISGQKYNHHKSFTYNCLFHLLFPSSAVTLSLSLSLMASRLSLISIPNLPTPARTFPKHPQQTPIFSLPPHSFHVNPSFNSRTISSSNGGSSPALHAVQEEVIPSTSSDSTSDSKTAPSSSSKVVLVIGGTGGVGIFTCCFSRL